MEQPPMKAASDLLLDQDNQEWESRLPAPLQDAESLKLEIKRHFNQTLGREFSDTTANYIYTALAMTVRDRLMNRWRETRNQHLAQDVKRTCYLSLEFLIGRTLSNALLNLDLTDNVREALLSLGLELEEIAELEHDAGLGNGGLGRLAACFLDSCATLGLPVTGYGIRYQYGMFRQQIENGYQQEMPDNWLREGHVWELERPELAQIIKFGGHTRRVDTRNVAGGQGGGAGKAQWVQTENVLAIPYDVPIPGYKNNVVNTLRLWSAASTDEFNLHEFNEGSYTEAVSAKNEAENITMVLYPNDTSENGKQLRLRQQYFLVSASLQDAIRIWLDRHDDFTDFSAKHCFQLNDTHPSLAVPELMRLLIDEHDMVWDDAWEIVTSCMAYTNHTLLPEALERWSEKLMARLLPRLLEITHEIDHRFRAQLQAKWPEDTELHEQLSVIEQGRDGHDNMVRMAHLAIVGSFSVNGVAQLHSDLLVQGMFNRFNEMWPDKFNNKTNGVTQRRWLAQCNPGLRHLLNDSIGEGWARNLEELEALVPLSDEAAFLNKWQSVKRNNKQRLAELVAERCNLDLNVDAIFDVQVKRMHEYKRQLLNALHAVHLYLQIKGGKADDMTPRAIIIAGKAAPGYEMAKAIIKLINNVADVINSDPQARGLLNLVFIPDYNVSAMEVICPGADLSSQISTAGKEASGTGNMKFMMNGALTIGTLDGANVEIREAVGEENFFLFGMTESEVQARRQHYNPSAVIAADPRVAAIFDAFDSGMFNRREPGIFDMVLQAALSPEDQWMTVADLPSFIDAQSRVAAAFKDQRNWQRMSVLNSAHSGRFSTDRTMQDYNRDIWRLTPVVSPLRSV